MRYFVAVALAATCIVAVPATADETQGPQAGRISKAMGAEGFFIVQGEAGVGHFSLPDIEGRPEVGGPVLTADSETTVAYGRAGLGFESVRSDSFLGGRWRVEFSLDHASGDFSERAVVGNGAVNALFPLGGPLVPVGV